MPIGYQQNGAKFKPAHWDALLRYHDTGAGRRYYDIQHRAICFKHYVGELQAGNLTIEVLPNADAVPGRTPEAGENFARWCRLLLRMLAEAGLLPGDSFHTALLRERENSLLDPYLSLFLTEIEDLLHRGLVKRYRQREGQVKALKGTLFLARTWPATWCTRSASTPATKPTTSTHLPHRLLRQALGLLPTLTPAPGLRGRAARALLAWPGVAAVRPTPATFARLRYDRKTADYRPALRIARLLLRPDVHSGPQDLIALFFNMNHIWEAYLLRTLQRLAPAEWVVSKPAKVVFWQAENGPQSRMQPDILLQHPSHGTIILDAKWKRPNGHHAENDLRQLFAYAHHFGATQTWLIYPQAKAEMAVGGEFTRPLLTQQGAQVIRCGISYIRVSENIAGIKQTSTLVCSLLDELPMWLA